MNTMQASEFKAKCLALMDEIARTGEPLVVTKHGKPVVQVTAYRPPRAKSLFGLEKGKIQILGDIISPIGADLWEAMK